LLTKEHKAVLAVTKEDVLRVYQQYLKGKYGVILSVYPKAKKS
jgi:zinc protease